MIRSATFLLGLFLAASAGAGDVSMAGGGIRFAVPDDWVPIVQTEGETESQVFQVPGAMAADAALARVSVTLQKLPNQNGFEQFRDNLRSRASDLPEYVSGQSKSQDENMYTAKEGKVVLHYQEHYFYRSGYAIQLRCIRPDGVTAWGATFDKSCADIAARLPA